MGRPQHRVKAVRSKHRKKYPPLALPAPGKKLDSPAALLGHKAPMPRAIHPMLATLVDGPFDDRAMALRD